MNLNNNTASAVPNPPTSYSSPLEELKAREATIATNLEILDNGAHQAAIGEELLAISQGKLYRAAAFRSFERYLDSSRNPMSRSRAYQLMRFAKKRHRATLEGHPTPANERQSRAAKRNVVEPNSFQRDWITVQNYLQKKFLMSHDPGKFAAALVQLAQAFSARAQQIRVPTKCPDMVEQSCVGQHLPAAQALVQAAGNDSPTAPHLSSPPGGISSSSGPEPQRIFPAGPAGHQSQTGAQAHNLASAAEHEPSALPHNRGPVHGLSMEEARCLGYVTDPKAPRTRSGPNREPPVAPQTDSAKASEESPPNRHSVTGLTMQEARKLGYAH